MAKRGRPKKPVKGIYHFQSDYVDDPPIIYFDGKYWLLPGDDHRYSLGNKTDHSNITKDQIGEMIYEFS